MPPGKIPSFLQAAFLSAGRKGFHDIARFVIFAVEVCLKIVAEHNGNLIGRKIRGYIKPVRKCREFLRFPNGEGRLAVRDSPECFNCLFRVVVVC